MRICLYGSKQDWHGITEMLGSLPECAYRKIELDIYTDYDSFTAGLRKGFYDAVLVTENGADGMEGVIAAGCVNKSIPVVWFSDDSGFGTQSYRLGAAYFHEKPFSPRILLTALDKCTEHIRTAQETPFSGTAVFTPSI